MKTLVLTSCTCLQPQLRLSIQSSFGTRSTANLLFTKSFSPISVLISGFYGTSRYCTPSEGPSALPAAVWLCLPRSDSGLPVPLIYSLYPPPSRCRYFRLHSQPSSLFLLHPLAILCTSTASLIPRMSVPVFTSFLSSILSCLMAISICVAFYLNYIKADPMLPQTVLILQMSPPLSWSQGYIHSAVIFTFPSTFHFHLVTKPDWIHQCKSFQIYFVSIFTASLPITNNLPTQ